MGFIPIHSRNDAFNDPGVCGAVISAEERRPFELLMKGGRKIDSSSHQSASASGSRCVARCCNGPKSSWIFASPFTR